MKRRRASPRNALHPCGSAPGPDPRRRHDAHRPREHVRAEVARASTTGTTTRAPATRRARALEGVPRRARRREARRRVRQRLRGDDRDPARAEDRRSRALRRRRLRRHVPHLRQGDEAVGPRGVVHGHERPGEGEGCDAPEHAPRLARDAVEPDAQDLRHRGDRRDRDQGAAPSSSSTTRSRRRCCSARSISARRSSCTRRRST